jgi:dihydrofolate reductase
MTIALIAACAGSKMVIGRDGDLPWHFPSDLQFFRETTKGQAVLMGRVTYQSILARLGKPLPQRRNLVVTRDADFQDDRVEIIRDLPAALQVVGVADNLFVIGGAQIYAQSLPYADILYVTHIDQEFDGDARFPAFDQAEWAVTEQRTLVENGVQLRFCTYRRQRP